MTDIELINSLGITIDIYEKITGKKVKKDYSVIPYLEEKKLKKLIINYLLYNPIQVKAKKDVNNYSYKENNRKYVLRIINKIVLGEPVKDNEINRASSVFSYEFIQSIYFVKKEKYNYVIRFYGSILEILRNDFKRETVNYKPKRIIQNGGTDKIVSSLGYSPISSNEFEESLKYFEIVYDESIVRTPINNKNDVKEIFYFYHYLIVISSIKIKASPPAP